jgi:hypothetical protein
MLAVAGLAALAVAVPGTRRAATGPAVPPLNGQALGQAIAGLPSSQQTAALVTVGGSAGRWSGTSGLADLVSSWATGPPGTSDPCSRCLRQTRQSRNVYLGEDLPGLLTSAATARQITPMARADQPRVERCASALDAGCVTVPSMLGSDLAGSVRYMTQAMIARMAMTARTATTVALPGDQPRARVACVISGLLSALDPVVGWRQWSGPAFWCTMSA